MIKITEEIKKLKNKLPDYAENICSYDCRQYVGSAIYEIADDNVDIYTSQLLDYFGNHWRDVEDKITELGWEGCGESLETAIQMVQLEEIESRIYAHLDEMILLYCYDYVMKKKGLDEITEEENDKIIEICKDSDADECLGYWEDQLDNLLYKEDEDDEED